MKNNNGIRKYKCCNRNLLKKRRKNSKNKYQSK